MKIKKVLFSLLVVSCAAASTAMAQQQVVTCPVGSSDSIYAALVAAQTQATYSGLNAVVLTYDNVQLANNGNYQFGRAQWNPTGADTIICEYTSNSGLVTLVATVPANLAPVFPAPDWMTVGPQAACNTETGLITTGCPLSIQAAQ